MSQWSKCLVAVPCLILMSCAGQSSEVFKYDRSSVQSARRIAVMGFVGEVQQDRSRIAIRKLFQEKLAEMRRFYLIPDDSIRQAVIDLNVQELPIGYGLADLRRVAKRVQADAVVYGENFSSVAREGQGQYILGGKDLVPHFHAALVTKDGRVVWKAWSEGEAQRETQLKKKLTLGLVGADEQAREAVESALVTLADYLVRAELPSGIDTHPHSLQNPN